MQNFSGQIIIDLELSVLCTQKYNISSWLPEFVFHAAFGFIEVMGKNSSLKNGNLCEMYCWCIFQNDDFYYWFAKVGICKMRWFSRRKSFYGCITDCFNRHLTESCFLDIYGLVDVTNDWFLKQKNISANIYDIAI